MTKPCLTCEDSQDNVLYNKNNIISKTKNVVPFWYKEIGNYSHLPPPLNCNSKYNRFEDTFEPVQVKGSPQLKITLNLSKLIDNQVKYPTWIYFWAAKKRQYHRIKYPYAPDAYDNFQNSGLVQTDKKGKTTFYLHNPEIYHVNGKVYSPHIHFTYLKDDKTWEIDAFTISIVPKIKLDTFKRLVDSAKYIVLNASNIYSNKTIKKTHSLPYNSNQDINDYINKLIINKYHKIKKSKLQLQESPIIVYCKNKKCKAANKLIRRLQNLSYINLIYFPGGIDKYN